MHGVVHGASMVQSNKPEIPACKAGLFAFFPSVRAAVSLVKGLCDFRYCVPGTSQMNMEAIMATNEYKEDSTGIWTVARIAAHLGVDRHRIEYLIDARRIKPIARAGIARIFGSGDVERLAREIQKIDAVRRGGAL